jgi:hypothetical protein
MERSILALQIGVPVVTLAVAVEYQGQEADPERRVTTMPRAIATYPAADI